MRGVDSRADGKTEVEIKSFGLVGRINDLHRGRDSGEGWRWMIDASAVLIVLACVTGVILWLALPKRQAGDRGAGPGIWGTVGFT